jgi:Ni,Fe-hydrogenase I large subunit
MTAVVQTLDISPVGRVEGDLDVRVDIQDGVIVNAWTQAELFRGLEVILRDKDPQAGLVVTPRACGICGASHLTCAAWALDTAWSTEVPRNAILARNLGQIVESLQSIPRHHYGLFMIDYTNKNYAKSKYYEEAVRRWSPFTGTHYEIGVSISGRRSKSTRFSVANGRTRVTWFPAASCARQHSRMSPEPGQFSSSSAATGSSQFGLGAQWSGTKKSHPTMIS